MTVLDTAQDAMTAPESVETLADLLARLGGVAPERVRLKPPPGTATEADLIAADQARNGRLCELVEGALVEKAGMSYRESLLGLVLGSLVRTFVIERNLGLVSGPDGMMRLFPGLVRLPDVAYVSWERVPGGRVPEEPIAGFAPDLAVEVLSESNTPAEMARKCREYFAAGVRLVWSIDPRKRTVTVFTAPDHSTILTASDTLDGGDVLPGFALSLADFFRELDRTA